MSEKQAGSPPAGKLMRIAGLALLGGIVAGALGIYVMETGSGNQSLAAACPASDAVKSAVDRMAKGEVAAVNALDSPFDARTISFSDGAGKKVALADFAGKTLLVNLWATWCVPCRAEMPALDALATAKGGKDFAVVPINVDLGDDDKPKAFLDKIGVKSLALYRDASMGVFNDLKQKGLALGLPISLIVDKMGCARAILSGPAEWASPDAARLIDAVKGSEG